MEARLTSLIAAKLKRMETNKRVILLMAALFLCAGASAQTSINRTSKPKVEVTKISKVVNLDYQELVEESHKMSDSERTRVTALIAELEGSYEVKCKNPRLKPAIPLALYRKIADNRSSGYVRLNLSDDLFVLINPTH